ncbi:O-antigen ligase family protein [Devosia sp. BK]|uniref:O-antigen ligase family protein n=1 Tax=Devosia sp. BK TaxID=2871706 RepID=UPI00293988FA|nr:O-antigen ligase family protein [Devosia sp. BK]MDV3253197.1 O-antigen ligase family protein [Devosia sp. BK]
MTRLNNFAGSLVVLVVVLSPIPFGSNRPFFWAIWGLVVAAAAFVYSVAAARNGEGLRIPLSKIGWSVGLWALLLLWLVVQVVPFGAILSPFSIALSGGTITSETISTAPGATWLMLIRIATYGLFFVLALQAGAKENRSVLMIKILFWGIVAHAGFSLIQLTQFGDTILGLPKIAYMGVATGTFINRNSFATFLAIGLSVGISLLPGIISAKRARNETVMDKIFRLFFHVAGLFVIMVALLATQSRMGLFAGLLGAFVVLLLVLKQNRHWKVLIPAAVAIAVAASLLIVWTFGQGVIERGLDIEGSSEGRMNLYVQVWDVIMTRPWTGYGGGAFSLFFPAFFGPPLDLVGFWDKAHNTYLALFSELGIPAGSLLMIASAILFGRILWSQLMGTTLNPARLAAIGAIITCAVHSLVDFSLEIQANTFLFVAVVALGLAATIRMRAPGQV